jgi:hypothetical protein
MSHLTQHLKCNITTYDAPAYYTEAPKYYTTKASEYYTTT